MKRVVRLYSGKDGESHLEDISFSLVKNMGNSRLSESQKAVETFYLAADGESNTDWHTAPGPQYIILLEGELEIEVADGAKRKLGPGDILLAEDTTGHGHLSRSMNRKAIVVRLAD